MDLSIVDISSVPEGGTQTDALHNTLDLARHADRLGFARYWVAEHHAARMQASYAPEALIPSIAAVTGRIRVGSGAVLLNHYSPFKVAETFRQLHATYPGRIDLGIGRATGGPVVDFALQRDRGEVRRNGAGEDYGQQLAEVLAWLWHGFPEDHPFGEHYPLMPGVCAGPPIWVLGSSTSSAAAAGQLGVPYTFAAFINPVQAREALQIYRDHFQPTETPGTPDQPHGMLALNAVCADTDYEAARLSMTVKGLYHRLSRGVIPERQPTPEEAIEEMGERPEPTSVDERWRARTIAGAPERVRTAVEMMAEESGADEVMVQDIILDQQGRLRSYELLAEAFDLSELAGATARS